MDQILELTERTDGGLNASPAKREQIAALVEELEAYCPRNPLRSPLLYGDYEVGQQPDGAGIKAGLDDLLHSVSSNMHMRRADEA